jgi:hypothetical protein
VQFYIIVNPDDGPDGSPGSQPDTTYQAGVRSLRGHANVLLLGYVLTGYGTRAQAAVTQDVQTYSGWTAAWGVDGIFFDETQAGLISTYQVYTDTVRAPKWASGTTGYVRVLLLGICTTHIELVMHAGCVEPGGRHRRLHVL